MSATLFGTSPPVADTSFSVGQTLSNIGSQAESSLVQAGTALITGLISKATGSVTGGGTQAAGLRPSFTINVGSIRGLGAVLAYMQGHTPVPTASVGESQRNVYAREVAAYVFGLSANIAENSGNTAQQVVDKAALYDSFRAYLAAFDQATGNQYNFASTMPARRTSCTNASKYGLCTDADNAQPAGLLSRLMSIGAQGLTTIDAVAIQGTASATATGGSVDTTIQNTVQNSSGSGSSSGTSAWDALINSLKSTGQNLLNSATNTLAGAAAGAQATSQGAATGSQSALAGMFSNPIILIGIAVVAVVLIRRR